MHFERGDHVCALYSTAAELAREVASFLADGLRAHERCWYVGAGEELDSVRAALHAIGIDVAAQMQRGALQLISGSGAYVVRGNFDPEATMKVFNDAIEQAYNDGFTGFRAAAEMSWAVDCEDGVHQVIVYEALLKTLFANCRAIGLCLYDRTRMPPDLLDGALRTHPVAGVPGHYRANPFYAPDATPADEVEVLRRMAQLEPAP